MKCKAAILTVVSGVMFCLMLVLLPVSYHLALFGFDRKSGQMTPEDSVHISLHCRCGFCIGDVWFFNLDVPYTGSIRRVGDGGSFPYQNGTARSTRDWTWHKGNFGFARESYIGEGGELVGRDRYADLPGIYYRHFVWWKEPTCWTLRVSLWYPIVFFGVLPGLWLIRRFRVWLNNTSLAKLLNASVIRLAPGR